MRSSYFNLPVVVMFLALAGCKGSSSSASSPDDLIGDYGVKTPQGVTPVLRVEGSGIVYSFSEYQGGKWVSTGRDVQPMNQADFNKLFGVGASVSFKGLESVGGGAVVQVPAGWHKDRLATQTGYLVVLSRGAMEAVKIQ